MTRHEIDKCIKELENEIVLFDKIDLSAYEQVDLRKKPKKYLLLAIELLKFTNNKTVVEIGGIRQKMEHTLEDFNPVCCNDGHSSEFWCSKDNLEVYSVDINPHCQQFYADLKNRKNNFNYMIGDGISFLNNFNKPIDLLFLDAWDVHVGSPYAEMHYEAYLAAKNNLADRHIISIDDTDIMNGGKGKILIPYLLKNGYNMVISGRQTILTNFIF
jgi:hypothetical protein